MQDSAGREHSAIEIAAIGHLAERARARALGVSGGQATHGSGAHPNMIVARAGKAHGSARAI